MHAPTFIPSISTLLHSRYANPLHQSLHGTLQPILPSPYRPIPHLTIRAESPVHDQLKSADFLERIRGINRIDELNSTAERIGALIPLATEDPNQQVRYAAISRLSNLDASSVSEEDGDRVLTAARYVLMNDRESSCQAGAADLIAGLKLRKGFEDLVECYGRTDDWMLKFSIAAGMGEMGDGRAFEFLKAIVDDEGSDPLFVSAAIGALGELGDERGLEVVDKYLENEDASVRERAAIAHRLLVGDEQN